MYLDLTVMQLNKIFQAEHMEWKEGRWRHWDKSKPQANTSLPTTENQLRQVCHWCEKKNKNKYPEKQGHSPNFTLFFHSLNIFFLVRGTPSYDLVNSGSRLEVPPEPGRSQPTSCPEKETIISSHGVSPKVIFQGHWAKYGEWKWDTKGSKTPCMNQQREDKYK